MSTESAAGTVRARAIFALALLAGSATVFAQPADRLVGTWQMVSEDVVDPASGTRVTAQSSDSSVGLLVYDDSGHMSVQIDRRAWNPQAGAGGYWGTYTVEPATHTVWLNIEWNSSGNLGRQKRGYELKDDGNTLVLTNERPGPPKTLARLTWRRLPKKTSSDPILGRWELNLTRSRFDPTFPLVRSQTRTYEDRGDGLVVASYEAVGAQGQRAFTHYAYKRDGKEYPELVRGARTAATIAFTAVDERVSAFVIRQDGMVTTTGTVTVAADGLSMINRTEQRTADGRQIVNEAFYDRKP